MRFDTWNARSLYRSGSLMTVVRELAKYKLDLPVPVAEQSKAHVYGRSLVGIAGSNPTGGMDGCPL